MAKFVLHCAVRSSLNRNGEKQNTLKQEQESEEKSDHHLPEAITTTKKANLWSYCCCINCNSSKLTTSLDTTRKAISVRKKKAEANDKVKEKEKEGVTDLEETINFWNSSINNSECNCLNCIQENFHFKFHSIESFFNRQHKSHLGNLSSSTQVSLSLNGQQNCSSSTTSSLSHELYNRNLGVLQQKLSPIYNKNSNHCDQQLDDLILSPKYSLRSLQSIYMKNLTEVTTTATTKRTTTTAIITAAAAASSSSSRTTSSNLPTNVSAYHLKMNGEGRQQRQQQQQHNQQQQQSHGYTTTMKRNQNMMLKSVNGTAASTVTSTTNNNNNNSNLKSHYNNNGFIRNGTIMTTLNNEKREHLYKILVIGELGTGKTSFIKRYVHQFFSQNYRATIGVDFALKVLHWDSNTVVRLQLWDIAGQERFGNMTRVYYKEAVGAFIVFDVTRSGTFECVSKWKEDLDSKVQLPDGTPIPCILLANKCDQEKQGTVANADKMDEYVRENGFAGWFETSAKENINIDEAARALVNKILLNDKLISSSDLNDGEKFNLNNTDNQNVQDNKGKCSC